MKIFEWNIGMAATIPSNQGYNLLPWIIDEIIKEEPDGIILTEFVVSKGIDYYIRELEKNNYHWFISSNTKSNGILIALKSASFIFKDTFDYSKSTINIGSDVLTGSDLPDFYEIKVEWNGQPLSVIGVRIKVDIIGKNATFKKNQFKALDDYLSNLNHNVICIGDYNAYWGNIWSSKKNTTLHKTASNNFQIYTPSYSKDNFSFVQSNGKKVQLDHLITNIGNKNNIKVKYDWSFINSIRYKCCITAETPQKPKGFPDHAILKVKI